MHLMLQLRRGRFQLVGYRVRARIGESRDGWLASSSSISQQGYADEGSNACDDQFKTRELGQEVTTVTLRYGN